MNFHSHEKKLTYTPSASGSYGKHVDEIRVDSEVFKIPNRLNCSDFTISAMLF